MESRIRDIVIAGGTAGIGNALALHYLRQGSRVTIVGSSLARGERFLAAAAQMDAADQAAFIRADLRSVVENRRVVEEVKARHTALDAVVLTALQLSFARIETPDGFETTFALYYISRFILSYGLTALLERTTNPVIVSVGGTGITQGKIRWDDLALQKHYGVIAATLQGGRANDLLGVAYARNHSGNKTRFILNNPGYTNTNGHHLPQPWYALLKVMGKMFAQPVEKSIQPIIALIENPPQQPLIAWERDKPVDLSLKTLDASDADRLYQLTKNLVAV